MSTPRFKKDKEIIAEYESQVKGLPCMQSRGVLVTDRHTQERGSCCSRVTMGIWPPASQLFSLVPSVY
ncbi:hypothetical protein ATANTOWER_012654 [Ataeniobius toweri]|uniref:Uncharacterized protein n=1 Tax=Ataeniobius toweri TaxID=208326 RepID=A0ABU7ANT7_9TELE|nr:hypothetical protein [Ataeniobius toweri]